MEYTDVSEKIHADPTTAASTSVVFEALAKLDRDLRRSAATMTEHEARYLVDTYYQLQRDRIRTSNRVFAMTAESGKDEPHSVIGWLHRNSLTLERNIQSALDVYSINHPVGEWSRSVKGIGPVIAAGLLAHTSMETHTYVGNLYTFAGLNPSCKWVGGAGAKKLIKEAREACKTDREAVLYIAEKAGRQALARTDLDNVDWGALEKTLSRRPWNATLKTLLWKAGESFVKVGPNPEKPEKEAGVYGIIYADRKALEIERNEAGQFADQAERALKERNIGKTTDAFKAYSQGKLPPAHIHARAKRYAVKFFLSHWYHVAHWYHHAKEPPLPWIIQHDPRHSHFVAPPNFDPATFPVREGVERQ